LKVDAGADGKFCVASANVLGFDSPDVEGVVAGPWKI
jgi:hypothetical protein